MAGSPKKRAKRLAQEEAARKALAEKAAERTDNAPPAAWRAPQDRTDNPALPFAASAYIPTSEVLPAVNAEDVTHTARKRAMRRKAAELAEEAISTLAKNMRGNDAKLAQDAADKILKAAGLHDPDKDKTAEGLVVQILKMATGVQ